MEIFAKILNRYGEIFSYLEPEKEVRSFQRLILQAATDTAVRMKVIFAYLIVIARNLYMYSRHIVGELLAYTTGVFVDSKGQESHFLQYDC